MYRILVFSLLCVLLCFTEAVTAKSEVVRLEFLYIYKSENDFIGIRGTVKERQRFYEGHKIPIEIVENFPNPKMPRIELYLPTKTGIELGLSFAQYSTGAELAYSDYSGSIEEKWSINTKSFGAVIRYNLNTNLIDSRITTKLGCYCNYLKTEAAIEQSVTVSALINFAESSIDANLYVFEPFVQFLYDFDYCQLGLSFGYSIETGRTYTFIREGIRQGLVLSVGL